MAKTTTKKTAKKKTPKAKAKNPLDVNNDGVVNAKDVELVKEAVKETEKKSVPKIKKSVVANRRG